MLYKKAPQRLIVSGEKTVWKRTLMLLELLIVAGNTLRYESFHNSQGKWNIIYNIIGWSSVANVSPAILSFI